MNRSNAKLLSGFLWVLGIAMPSLGHSDEESKAWDIESAPGPSTSQSIDVDEGTWMNLDVSPDGKHIVFDLLGDIYMMPLEIQVDGAVPEKVTEGIAWDMQPRFSPDGKSIAFTSDRAGKSDRSGDNIWIKDLASGKLTQVTNETYRLVNGPAWSPDGNYIVARKHFTSRRSLGAGEMWLYHRAALAANSLSGEQLTKKPTEQKDVNEPVFSPDGKFLYYSEDVSPGSTFEYDKDSNKQIYVIKRLELATGETEVAISGAGGACRPTPSPDGKQIAFVRRVGELTGLHVFDIQSGAVRLVYDQLERDMQEAWAIHGVYPTFAWTPDCKRIIVWAKGKIRDLDVKSGEAKVIPFRVQDERKITEALRFPIEVAPDEFDVKMLRNVQVTPNGKQVIYQALGYLYLKDLEGGNRPVRLTQQTSHFEFMPSLSHDGRYVTYVAWNDQSLGQIRVCSTDPSANENWVATQEPGHFRNPCFSPDGNTIVFEKGTGGSLTSPHWSQQPGLYQVASRGGELQLISKSGNSPRFADDNSRVFYLKSKRESESDNLGLYSIALDGSDLRQHYNSNWATDYVVSRDGKWIGFIERFNVYIAPFVQAGKTIQIGPKASNLPVVKVSSEAGKWLHFSSDSSKIHWSLGPDLYSVALDEALRGLTGDADESDEDTLEPAVTPIGFSHPHAKPESSVAIVGGKIVTMQDGKVIEDGTILIKGNRIVAMGERNEVEIPEDATVTELSKGQIVLPGFVDTHAHGSQASGGITPQRNWVDFARLAFGVTTVHDPSNDTDEIFAASELAKAGLITSPRTFSTGTILYGATGSYHAEVESLEDAKFHLRRMKAVGAFSVKSYNQPRRDQRQQVVAAARELEMMVVPEGGSTFMHNMTMIVDGHTGIEHTLPVQTAYKDVFDLWRNTGVGYTPTLCVAYGGISGEQYWYQVDDLWLHPRLLEFTPPHFLTPRARRRNKAPDVDYNHMRVAEIAKQRVDDGGLVQAGGHGQLNGICTHWEMWSFVQGGMTPMQALQCGTINGAKYLGLDADIGSLAVGKLADLIVIQEGSDPTQEIRDSEDIQYVVANGRMFAADRMNELGSPAPREPFYWAEAGYGGISGAMPRVRGCGCSRPGSIGWAPTTLAP